MDLFTVHGHIVQVKVDQDDGFVCRALGIGVGMCIQGSICMGV